MIVQSDKEVFFDNEGNVLESGYIYIGQPSTDPKLAANQKTVTFKDAGGSEFTAIQPLRTIGGKIAYNGLPIIATVEGEHCILIQDSAGNQVDYSASVGAADAVDVAAETIRVGLILDDVKAFDVSVGDVVRNVGESVATDSLGADWLVVSATGSPGDDVDLIDFDNGLQGRRDKSKVYRKEGIGTHILDTPDVIVNTTDATAYRNTWTSVDISSAVPATAHAAIVRVDLSTVYPTSIIAASASVFAFARMTGSGAATGSATRIGRAYNEETANAICPVGFVSEFTVKLDGSASFDLYVVVNDPTSAANNTTPDLAVSVVGYIVNQE